MVVLAGVRDSDAAEVVLLRAGVEVARWALPRGSVDLAVVDGLASLQLVARRAGCTVVLEGAPDELIGLLDLVGLGEVIPAGLPVEVGGEAEDGEQAGVEEVVVPDDPVARDLDHL